MTVLVVDDELPIREWLKFTIEKCAPDDTKVIHASNGQEAFSLLQSQAVDIIFTDIKMPVMDGLELLRRIRETGKKIYVVLLTSYADFDYVRTALSMKAEAYVLKNEISKNVIEEIFSQYDRSKSRNLTLNNNDLQLKRAALLKHIINNSNITAESLEEEFLQVGVTLEVGNLIMAAVKYCKKTIEIKTPIENFITYDENLRNIACFIYDMETYIIVANVRSNTENGSRAVIWNSISQKLESIGTNNFYVGVSEICDNLNNLSNLLSHSIEALNQYFYTACKVNLYSARTDDQILLEKHLESRISNLLQKIEYFNLKDFRQEMAQLMDSIACLKPYDTMQIKKRCIEILRDLVMECDNRFGKDLQDSYRYWDEYLMNAETFFEFRAYYEQCIQEITDKCLLGIHNEYIKKAILFIYQNYDTIESIEDICNAININKEYLCRLFKKETGKTINAYLTQYRLGMAKKLLQTTDLNISEVAVHTGYLNTNYFSRLYKSVMGVNPKDERPK